MQMKVIPRKIISCCSECPMRMEGGVVEDTCGQEGIWLGAVDFNEELNSFPDFCPLEDADVIC